MNSRQCARPGCSATPAAWLGYDYQARCAWLDEEPLDEQDQAHRWPLCRLHAATLKVPRGWFSVDRRPHNGGLADVDGSLAVGGTGGRPGQEEAIDEGPEAAGRTAGPGAAGHVGPGGFSGVTAIL